MMRTLHSALGLVAAMLIVVMALSGAMLSIDAVRDRFAVPSSVSAGLTVAELAEVALRAAPGVERIERKASGAFVMTAFDQDRPTLAVIDPATGAVSSAPEPSAFMLAVRNLHRKLLLDDAGRAAVGLGTVAMLALSLSGLVMLARRLGGWRRLIGLIRGTLVQRLHGEVARAAFLGLLLSAATGAVMSLTTFEVLPDGSPAQAPDQRSAEGPTLPPSQIAALRQVPASDLRALAFPAAGDPTDIYRLATAKGEITIDRTSGVVLGEASNTAFQTAYDFIYRVHTGEVAWPLTLLLGLSSAAVPLLAGTGFAIWLARRRARPRIARNAPAASADTVILGGSEGNTTWGFAGELHRALTQAGHRVHSAAMNDLASAYPSAHRLLLLTATYGEGEAPASASRFLELLQRFHARPDLDFAVLGFGDRQFPRFCAFADDVDEAMTAKGLRRLLATGRIDRQSPQSFADWGRSLGRALGIDLELAYVPARPSTVSLRLVERSDYGAEVGAPTAVLCFGPVEPAGRVARLFGARLPRFEAGDLVGIMAPGADIARFYSLASSRRDGVMEICVRLQPGGLCSSFLHGLRKGDTIEAFIRPNPAFRPAPGHAPVILIGAGAGVGPLAGFIRANAARRPMHLYFGARDPASDFLYERELKGWLHDRRLTALRPTFSRAQDRAHVQHRLAADAEAVRALIAREAQILVCGGRDMAHSVAEVLEGLLAPLQLTVSDLKRQGRYVEDVY